MKKNAAVKLGLSGFETENRNVEQTPPWEAYGSDQLPYKKS
jgi:hypothetical protein